MGGVRLPGHDWYSYYDDDKPTGKDTNVDIPERKIKQLLGPKGEVLRTISDKPPVGFHQGERRP